MRDDWRSLRLGELLKPRREMVPVASMQSVPYAGVRWYGLGVYSRPKVDGSRVVARELALIHAGQVTYNRMWATKGAFGVAGPDVEGCVVTNDFPIFDVLPDLLPAYLSLLIATRAFQSAAASLAVGTTERRRLLERDFLQLPIKVPPVAKQRRIVDLASAADLSGSASGRLALAADAARSAVFERYADEIKDAQTAPLGMIADVVSGVTKDQKQQKGDQLVEVPYLRVANVQRGHLNIGDMTTIRVQPNRAANLRLKAGDILFNEGGDRDKLGRGWVWEEQIRDCIHQNHVLRARLKTADFDPWFVSIWGNSSFGRTWFELNGSQTTNLASLSLSTLKGFPIPVVPIVDQRRVVELWLAMDQVAKGAQAVSAATAALRTAVLSRLLEGDHEIPDTYDRFLDGVA